MTVRLTLTKVIMKNDDLRDLHFFIGVGIVSFIVIILTGIYIETL